MQDYFDACSKTLVRFNKKFYELKDAFTMGSLLNPALVNIIMEKLEEKLIEKFVEDDRLYYMGTLLMAPWLLSCQKMLCMYINI